MRLSVTDAPAIAIASAVGSSTHSSPICGSQRDESARYFMGTQFRTGPEPEHCLASLTRKVTIHTPHEIPNVARALAL